MFGLLRITVDTFNDDLLRALVPEKQSLVQFPGNVIHALVVAQYPLGDGLADFSYEPLHIQIF